MSIQTHFFQKSLKRFNVSTRNPSKKLAVLTLLLQISAFLAPFGTFRSNQAQAEVATPQELIDAGANTVRANAAQSYSNENAVILANNLVASAHAMAASFRAEAGIYSTAVGNINRAIAQNVTAINAASASVAGSAAVPALTANNTLGGNWASTLGTLASTCGNVAVDLDILADKLQVAAQAVTATTTELKSVAQTCDTGTEIAAGVSTLVAVGVASQLDGNPYAKGSSASGTQLGVGIAGGVAGALINSQLGVTKTAASTSGNTATVAGAGICGSFLVDGYEGISYFGTAKTISQNLKTDQAILNGLQSNTGGNSGGAAFVATIASDLPVAADPSPGALTVTQQSQVKKAVNTLKYVEPITYVEAAGYTGLAAYCGFQCLALYGSAMGSQQEALSTQYTALNQLMAKATTPLKNYSMILAPAGAATVSAGMMGCPLVSAEVLNAPILALTAPALVPTPAPPPAPIALAAANKNAQTNTFDMSQLARGLSTDFPVPLIGSTNTDSINLGEVASGPPVSTPAAVNRDCVKNQFEQCQGLLEKMANLGHKCSKSTLDNFMALGCSDQAPCAAGGSNAPAKADLRSSTYTFKADACNAPAAPTG